MRKLIAGEIEACLQIMPNGFQMLFEEHVFVGCELKALHELVAMPDGRLQRKMDHGERESDMERSVSTYIELLFEFGTSVHELLDVMPKLRFIGKSECERSGRR